VAEPEDPQAIKATEKWFVEQGLPHFIFRYAATRNVWARAVPLLVLVFIGEIAITAPNRKYSLAGSIGAVIGCVAALVAIWAVVNRLRERPAISLPDRIGPIEVFVFALGPAAVPLVFGGQWRSALVTAVINVALLALITLATSYGIVPMSIWAIRHGADQIRTVVGVLVRALPLVFLIVIVVFVNTEAWQVASELHWPVLIVVGFMFVGVGALFAFIRVPGQIGEVDADTWDERRALVGETPAAPLLDECTDAGEPPPLSRREWRNLQLVVLVSEGILVTLVGVAMFLFLVVLGVLSITPGVIETWIGREPQIFWEFDLFNEHLAVTGELMKVCGFLAAFSALQFTVSLVSSGEQQEEFLHQLREELREALAVRAAYLHVMISRASGGKTPTTMSPT
jgi:hypothetical protein